MFAMNPEMMKGAFQNMGAGGPAQNPLMGMGDMNQPMDPKMAMMLQQFGKMMQGPQKKGSQHDAMVQSMMSRAMMGR